MLNDLVWCEYFRSKEKEHGHFPIPPGTVSNMWDFWPMVCCSCFSDCMNSHDIWMAHKPRPLALKVLHELAFNNELHLITTRPPSAVKATYEWLEKYGIFECFTSINITEDKRAACDRLGLDYHLDDAPHNYEALVGSTTKVVMFDAVYNWNIPAEFRVHGWEEFGYMMKLFEGYRNTSLGKVQAS